MEQAAFFAHLILLLPLLNEEDEKAAEGLQWLPLPLLL